MRNSDRILAAGLATVTLTAGLTPAAMAADTTPAPTTGGETQTGTGETALTRAITAAEKKIKDGEGRNWDKDSKTVFDKALAKARATNADSPDAAQTATDLEKATIGLTTVELKALDRARQAANGLNAADYTDATGAAFTAALTTANGRFEDSAAGDAQARLAADNLTRTIDGLIARSYQKLKDSIDAATGERGRKLTYPDETARDALVEAHTTAKNVLGDPKNATAEITAKRDKARDTLDKALAAVKGKSNEQTAFEREYAKVKDRNPDNYKDSTDFAKALDEAKTLDTNTASGDTFKNLTTRLAGGETLKVAGWTVDGRELTETGDGNWTLTLDETAKSDLPQAAVGRDGSTVTLTAADTGRFTQGGRTLGVGTEEYRLTGTAGDGSTITVIAPVTAGTETTVTLDGQTVSFHRDENGTWTATPNGDGLLGTPQGKDGSVKDVTAWTGHKVALSDKSGVGEPVLGDVTETQPKDTLKTMWTRTVDYMGTDAHGTPVRVHVDANRTWDATARLRIVGIDADNKETVILDTGEQDIRRLKDTYTLNPVDRANIGFRYRAEFTAASVNGTPVVTNGIGANGERTFTITGVLDTLDGTAIRAVNRTIRASVPFTAPKRETSNTAARLEGFRVKGGTLNPDFDPDILDYTIRLKEGEHVSVTPITGRGVKAVAGDVAQTAFTTVQSWTVTASNGENRTYTVTVVRDHTTKTADEAFAPKDAIGMVSDKPNPSDTNTSLESWGYTLNGRYTPITGDTFQIPEGGVLSYRDYEGQTVSVTGTRTHGMTWDYEVGVLAADHETYGSHILHVTYITADTHRAGLTGIKVDGRDITGFDPARHEYTVKVADPTQYVVSPRFDKMTGMSVSTHKTDGLAVVTATSADGLVKSTYTLHVVKSPLLAATGVAVTAIAGVLALIIAAGVALTVLARRGKTASKDDGDAKDENPSEE